MASPSTQDQDEDDYMADVSTARELITSQYGTSPLQPSEIVMIMQGWNKVLAYKSSFSEALVVRWRQLVSPETYSAKVQKHWRAIGKVERNEDILAFCLGARLADAEELIMGFLDGVIRGFCPEVQRSGRETYRPIKDDVIIQRKEGDMTSECETVKGYTRLFARCGVEPHYWVFFCDAFLWAMKTHVPYAREEDKQDLEKGPRGAFAKAVSIVAMKAIDGYESLHRYLQKDIFTIGVQRFWTRLDQSTKNQFGAVFYETLLNQYPQLLDYFARSDMDSLAIQFIGVLDLLVRSIQELGTTGPFRDSLDRLGEIHRQRKIPTFSYAIFGSHLLDSMQELLLEEEKVTKHSDFPVTATQLTQAYAFLYTELMSIVYYPMLLEEKRRARAVEFYNQVKVELEWTEKQFRQRITQVEQEIGATGTYHQTSEEIELGARLAWRNSAKCVGRISWRTLQVRDRRHVTEPAGIFSEMEEHLKIATAGDNIQSVMTVFKPLSPHETLGTRFWSSQLVRYAAYKNSDGSITGDPANLELTQYLMENSLWEAPEDRTSFDVLPLVLKVPGISEPYVYQLPRDCIHEVNIEHPTNDKIAQLSCKWTTIPAITNFKIDIGGVVYANIPFNGWFVSTEIVRNLVERYDVGTHVATALGLNVKTDPMWQQHVSCELERAVLYSFQKYGSTIVDPIAVGKSFCTHVQKEREEFGRECPAQWSWIGGFLGPTNPTWHLEMRDFLVKPQYGYCMEGVLLYKCLETESRANNSVSSVSKSLSSTSSISKSTTLARPRILIAYGSETGNAESAARRLRRELQLLNPTLRSLNEFADEMNKIQHKEYTHVIFICSTFGNGRPPSNAKRFFDAEVMPRALEGLKYAVLALGSSLYQNFCKAGISLDRKMAVCGLGRLIPLEKIDQAAGAEGAISEWIGLMRRLILPAHIERELMSLKDVSAMGAPRNILRWENKQKSMEQKTMPSASVGALCLSNTELLITKNSDRSIRKITFELLKEITYETGDHLLVHPVNSSAMVKRFLKCFAVELDQTARLQSSFPHTRDCSEDETIEWQSRQYFEMVCIDDGEENAGDVFFKTPTTLLDLLHDTLDLSLSSKNVEGLLTLLDRQMHLFFKEIGKDNKVALDDVQKDNLVQEFQLRSREVLDAALERKTEAIDLLIAEFPTVVDFLEYFSELFLASFAVKKLGWKTTAPILPLAEVLVVLSKLQPRYYSIASSASSSPNHVTITVGVLKTTTSKGKAIEGVCSNYLASMREGTDRAHISVLSSSFRLLSNHMAPLIMVAAGTGLSPCIGFLEEKESQWQYSKDDAGPLHLFFGCRTEQDFIYRDIIKAYENKKMLSLHLALSRPRNSPKKYVQHRIAQKGKGLAALLRRKDTRYFVCGDARMAEDCFEACVEVLREHAVMSRVTAVNHLRAMQLEGRWQSNVWGIVSHYENSKSTIERERKMKAKLWLSSLAGES